MRIFDIDEHLKSEPEYYYRVDLFATTFGADKDKTPPFEHEEFFRGEDLLKCRENAFAYAKNHIENIDRNGYVFPFASPANTILGKTSAFSCWVFLIEDYGNISYDHQITGTGDNEGYELEKDIFKSIGINI